MAVIYRKCEVEDAYQFKNVEALTFYDTYKDILPKDFLENKVNSINSELSFTNRFLENNGSYNYVACDGNKIVGILSFNIFNKCGHIDSLYVLPEYQGNGIGKSLFRIAVSFFIENNISKMDLYCLGGSKAIDFYKKYCGYISGLRTFSSDGIGRFHEIIINFKNMNDTLAKLDENKFIRK